MVNSVVTSVEGSPRAFATTATRSTVCARVPGRRRRDLTSSFACPSLPLPTRTPYRLTLPSFGDCSVYAATIERLHLVHVHSPFVTGWIDMRYARRYGCPSSIRTHAQLRPARTHSVGSNRNTLRDGDLDAHLGDSVDAVVVPTNAMLNHLRELGVNTRIVVVPSGVDVAHFEWGPHDEALRARIERRERQRRALRRAAGKRGRKPRRAAARARARKHDDLRPRRRQRRPGAQELEALAADFGIPRHASASRCGSERAQLPDLYAGKPCDTSSSRARARRGIRSRRSTRGGAAHDRCRTLHRKPRRSSSDAGGSVKPTAEIDFAAPLSQLQPRARKTALERPRRGTRFAESISSRPNLGALLTEPDAPAALLGPYLRRGGASSLDWNIRSVESLGRTTSGTTATRASVRLGYSGGRRGLWHRLRARREPDAADTARAVSRVGGR